MQGNTSTRSVVSCPSHVQCRYGCRGAKGELGPGVTAGNETWPGMQVLLCRAAQHINRLDMAQAAARAAWRWKPTGAPQAVQGVMVAGSAVVVVGAVVSAVALSITGATVASAGATVAGASAGATLAGWVTAVMSTGTVVVASVVAGWVAVGAAAAGWVAPPRAPAGSRSERVLRIGLAAACTASVAFLTRSWAWSVSWGWRRTQLPFPADNGRVRGEGHRGLVSQYCTVYS